MSTEYTTLIILAAPPIQNQLITELPKAAAKRLIALCQFEEVTFGTFLCVAGERQTHAYFPLDGFISLISTLKDHPPLEIGLIGSEGMLGATLVLGVLDAPTSAVVQGHGSMLRISAARLSKELQRSPSLRGILQRYVYVLLAQNSRLIPCIHFHSIEARLARWLLMTHDRAHADSFSLTHAYLADMLGVTRSGVSIAAGHLQLKKLISYVRGAIKVLDRAGLERASCECYEALRSDYAQQLG